MSNSTTSTVPVAECDVVMKGGITSGVIYPTALVEFAATYRLRSLGGASAGAIGAALGAAAEFGRAGGGFARLAEVPSQLGDGRLAALFQPQPQTRALLPLLLAATGHDRPGPGRTGAGRVFAVLGAIVRGFPVASALGLLPGLALAIWGVFQRGWLAVLVLVLVGLVLAVVGWLVAILVRLNQKFSQDLPANLFGICRGLATDGPGPGFTDWLAGQIDDLAGLAAADRPLRFGQLWTGSAEIDNLDTADRQIDLRMISTCLSQSRPYELPWEAAGFFFDPAAWATLFPPAVMAALLAAPPARPTPPSASVVADWEAEEAAAAAHSPGLRRLPSAEHVPVIVATRMSLSFPLLISAIPLWTINRRKRRDNQPAVFVQVWFTDGGLCSNFPVQLFDSALPTRPTFAINLGDFPVGQEPQADQSANIEYARNNRQGLLPELKLVPATGWGAIAGFATGALDTARGWPDGTQLNLPGYRDRIVRVLQSKAEGGLNLFMDTATITSLADRGRAAARAMIEQFNQPRYPESAPTATGWDNHRWVRYRALLSGLPDWLGSYQSGRAGMEQLVANPPSYPLSGAVAELAEQLTQSMDAAAAVLTPAAGPPPTSAVKALQSQPAPTGVIRRMPRI